MRQKTGFKLGGLIGLLVVALGLLNGCSGGVSQADYDAAKQRLTAKEQEVAKLKQDLDAAKASGQQAAQQVSALQQQLKPAAPQEPKRLEAKITIEMGETPNEMFFANSAGVKGGPFRLPAGKTVGLHFVNTSPDKTHEVMFGRTLMMEKGMPHGYEVNPFEKVAADVFVYPPGKKVEIGGSEFEEIEVGPGAEVWIRVVFPAELKGEWEIGCFVQEPNVKGHYEQGMKAKLIIE